MITMRNFKKLKSLNLCAACICKQKENAFVHLPTELLGDSREDTELRSNVASTFF